MLSESTSTSVLRIVSAMITPAILMLAAGSLVNSTLTRLARVVDRARVIIDRVSQLYADGKDDLAREEEAWLWTYNRRVALAERALTFYYAAILFFIGTSLAIALNSVGLERLPWVAIVLVVLGVIFLSLGTAALVLETNLAVGTLRREISLSLGTEKQKR
jgi:hypothetical protein